MSNVSNSVKLHIVHNPDLLFRTNVLIIKIQTVQYKGLAKFFSSNENDVNVCIMC